MKNENIRKKTEFAYMLAGRLTLSLRRVAPRKMPHRVRIVTVVLPLETFLRRLLLRHLAANLLANIRFCVQQRQRTADESGRLDAGDRTRCSGEQRPVI
jgi:hypothetical protein